MKNVIHRGALFRLFVQSGEYTFGADIISNWKKLDFEDSRILLKMMFFPKQCTVSMIRRFCVNPASFIMKINIVLNKYFDN